MTFKEYLKEKYGDYIIMIEDDKRMAVCVYNLDFEMIVRSNVPNLPYYLKQYNVKREKVITAKNKVRLIKDLQIDYYLEHNPNKREYPASLY